VASNAEAEEAGSDEYRDNHMSQIFKEGLSFSGFERDYLGMSLGRVDQIDAALVPGTVGNDVRFLDISGVSGIDSLSDGRGAAFADFDNDGDTDVFLVALQGTAHYLFRNNIGSRQNFLRVSLEGTTSGRDAFGAIVRVKTSAGVLTKVKAGGSGYLAQHDPRLLFGLGTDQGAEWLEVEWPSGQTQRIDLIVANSSLRIVESGGATRPVEMITEHRFALVDPLGPEDALFASTNLERGGAFPNLIVQPLPPAAGPTPEAGDAATQMQLYDLLRPGRRTLLNIWATWCIPCRKEMPELELLYPDFDAAGIDLIGLSIDTDTRAAVRPFAESVGATYPIWLVDDARFGDIYMGNEVFVPMSVLLDDNGRVLRVVGGWSPQTAAAFRELAGHDSR